MYWFGDFVRCREGMDWSGLYFACGGEIIGRTHTHHLQIFCQEVIYMIRGHDNGHVTTSDDTFTGFMHIPCWESWFPRVCIADHTCFLEMQRPLRLYVVTYLIVIV